MDVAAVDEVVIRLDIQAVVEISCAVVVNLVLDELVIVGRGVARENLDKHSLGAGIFNLAIADTDMRGSAAGQGHDIDIGAGGGGAVEDEAVDGDITHRALDTHHELAAAGPQGHGFPGVGSHGDWRGASAGGEFIDQILGIRAGAEVERIAGVKHAGALGNRGKRLHHRSRIAV